MKALLLALAICAASLLPAQKPETTMTAPSQPAVHVSTSFTFNVNAPLQRAAPLFGPEGERAWAGDDWNPQFLFPVPARDVEGAVFTLRHGEDAAVWVNTLFDLNAGRMQYVYVLGNLLATTINVRLHTTDALHTKVDVTYDRTALRPEANGHVAALAQHDQKQGEVWEKAINDYLLRKAGSR
jgi:hypothetical protein